MMEEKLQDQIKVGEEGDSDEVTKIANDTPDTQAAEPVSDPQSAIRKEEKTINELVNRHVELLNKKKLPTTVMQIVGTTLLIIGSFILVPLIMLVINPTEFATLLTVYTSFGYVLVVGSLLMIGARIYNNRTVRKERRRFAKEDAPIIRESKEKIELLREKIEPQAEAV